ncbi:hypothetical protein DQ04_15421000 [Trypanosoma grayi]|uniref:hypothetical protein n=1 Tax=Trypanosoma grayi TaxID=71804 RepID=UPI0004F44EAE|nr:hypothetical protein DQ04_15421000 [Trypanosoma grayi]KEG06184.1 hypothetical protein DQ04_15421000 [Trypanosoma grayi]
MATPAADDDPSVTLTNCFPSVVLNPSNIPYTCEVSDAQPLIDLDLSASYYNPAGLNPGWPATLVEGTNTITFVPDRGAPSGRWGLVITKFAADISSFTPMTTNKSMDFMLIGTAHANFATLYPYYGMGVSFAPNLPSGTMASDYMLVRSFNDCRYTTTTCTDTVGCYRMLPPGKLPPPGEYRLCVTSNDWHDQYLLWGAESLEVKLLLSTPLYLTSGKDRNVVLQDAESVVSVLRRVFLVRCPGNNCPLVTTGSGEEVVHRDACVNTSVSSRVYLSDLRVLSAEAGVYAVCVDDGDGEYTAPAALPVTVLQKPFAFKITVDTDQNTATIDVSGGDLKWRREPYTVCAVPLGLKCDSATTWIVMCEKSELPWSPSIFLNITKSGLLAKDMKFCFLAANVTIGGRTHTQMFDLSEGKGEKKLSAGVIAGIVIGCIAFLIVAVAVFYFCYWRRRPNASRDDDYPSASVLGHPTKRRSYPVGNSRVTSREGDDGNSRSIGGYPSLFLPSEVDNPMSDRQTGESTFPNVGSTGPQYHDGYSDAMTSTSFAPHGSGYAPQSYGWSYPSSVR